MLDTSNAILHKAFWEKRTSDDSKCPHIQNEVYAPHPHPIHTNLYIPQYPMVL